MRNLSKVVLSRMFAVALLGSVAAAPSVLAAGVDDDVPDTHYACQVETESGIAGLVFVQAKNMDAVRTIVKGASAKTLAGESSRATAIVQCIERGEKFRDSTIQTFYKQYPR